MSSQRDDDIDDPVYLNARREGLVAFLGWLVAGVVTISVSLLLGYSESDGPVGTILGMPTWVVWGVLVPWIGCIAFGVWFSFFVKPDDLGSDPETGDE